ncbi:hypothetical protein BT93_E2331 [Corymbia citriodora subsp. variegata]|nr:hypothetical protein BT93_E2331 [Corymbia citriodora subsp. variegata]
MLILYWYGKAWILDSKRNRTQKTSQTNHRHQYRRHLGQRESVVLVNTAMIFPECSIAVVRGSGIAILKNYSGLHSSHTETELS